MTTRAGWIDWQSPWLYGGMMFLAWVTAQPLVGILFEDGAAGTIDGVTIIVGLILAAISFWYEIVLSEHEYPS